MVQYFIVKPRLDVPAVARKEGPDTGGDAGDAWPRIAWSNCACWPSMSANCSSISATRRTAASRTRVQSDFRSSRLATRRNVRCGLSVSLIWLLRVARFCSPLGHFLVIRTPCPCRRRKVAARGNAAAGRGRLRKLPGWCAAVRRPTWPDRRPCRTDCSGAAHPGRC